MPKVVLALAKLKNSILLSGLFVRYLLKICSKYLIIELVFALMYFLSVSDFTAYQKVENIIS